MKPLVIYHSPCQDGFTAAWAILKVHPDWEFYAAKYGEKPPDVTGRDVYMVDFSYKRPVIENIISEASSLTILDHHKTAKEDLENLGELEIPLLTIRFDMEKSGARLAWDYFHGGNQAPTVPAIITHVEDRDLWRFKLDGTKEITTCLFAIPYDFELWDKFAIELEFATKEGLQILLAAGDAIIRKQAKDIEELAANKFRMKIGGYDVWTVNVPYTYASDMAHFLAKDEPFAATWYYDGSRNKIIFSLRSDENGIDVSEVAKLYGGGGHKHAAGFERETVVFALGE